MVNGLTNGEIIKALRATHGLGALVVDEETIVVSYHSGIREFLTPSEAYRVLRNYDLPKDGRVR